MPKVKVIVDKPIATGAALGEIIEVSDERAVRWIESGLVEAAGNAARKALEKKEQEREQAQKEAEKAAERPDPDDLADDE